MKGTEKQIALAQEIRNRISTIFDETIEANSAKLTDAQKSELRRIYNKHLGVIDNAHAGAVITLFADVRSFTNYSVALKMSNCSYDKAAKELGSALISAK